MTVSIFQPISKSIIGRFSQICGNFFREKGIECELLELGANQWQKGTLQVKILALLEVR